MVNADKEKDFYLGKYNRPSDPKSRNFENTMAANHIRDKMIQKRKQEEKDKAEGKKLARDYDKKEDHELSDKEATDKLANEAER